MAEAVVEYNRSLVGILLFVLRKSGRRSQESVGETYADLIRLLPFVSTLVVAVVR
jgi:hypothetical protein